MLPGMAMDTTGGMPGPPLLQRFRGQETAGGTAMVMDWQTHGTPPVAMMTVTGLVTCAAGWDTAMWIPMEMVSVTTTRPAEPAADTTAGGIAAGDLRPTGESGRACGAKRTPSEPMAEYGRTYT